MVPTQYLPSHLCETPDSRITHQPLFLRMAWERYTKQFVLEPEINGNNLHDSKVGCGLEQEIKINRF
jgi:hypothetical protein